MTGLDTNVHTSCKASASGGVCRLRPPPRAFPPTRVCPPTPPSPRGGVGQFTALWMRVAVGGGALKRCERMIPRRFCFGLCVLWLAHTGGYFNGRNAMGCWHIPGRAHRSLPPHAAAGVSAAAGRCVPVASDRVLCCLLCERATPLSPHHDAA
jgi:hypothetical protein